MLDKLPLIKSLIAWITLKKVFMLALGALVCIVSLTIFENRQTLVAGGPDYSVTRPLEHVRLRIRENVQAKLRGYVDSNPNVALVSVTSANIRLNEADVVFWYSDDPVITFTMNEFFAKNGTTRPLFMTDEAFNANMVRTINGDYICMPSAQAMVIMHGDRVPFVCRISIPPHFGQFSGFVTVGLSRKPALEEIEDVRRIISEASSNIFFDNIR